MKKTITKIFCSILITTALLSCFNEKKNSHEQLNRVTQYEPEVSEIESNNDRVEPANEENADKKLIKVYKSGWTDYVPDLKFLTEMSELEEIDIHGNNILTDISPLSSLTRLKNLSLLYTPNIKSIEPLSKLVNLEFLEMDYIRPTDCAELANLKKLKELYINSQITSVHYIAGLTKLEILTLCIAYENLDIYELGQLVNLKELYLYGYNVRINLDGLSQLTNLEHISLNRFVDLDLSPLRTLPKLEKVDLDKSTVSNIMNLLDNKAIKVLNLPSNYNELPREFYDRLETTDIRWGYIDGR